MGMYKIVSYVVSALLWALSLAITALALKFDYDGYVMAAQTLSILAGVVAIWAMTALLAGKG